MDRVAQGVLGERANLPPNVAAAGVLLGSQRISRRGRSARQTLALPRVALAGQLLRRVQGLDWPAALLSYTVECGRREGAEHARDAIDASRTKLMSPEDHVGARAMLLEAQ